MTTLPVSRPLAAFIATSLLLGTFFGGAYVSYSHQQDTAMIHKIIPPFPTSGHVTDECRQEIRTYNKALLLSVYRTSNDLVAEPTLSAECNAQMSYYYTGPSIKDVYR